MSHEKIASTFNDWVSTGRADGLEQGHGDVVGQVIPQMGIRPGMQSLDLGCGTGWATRILASAAPGAGAVGIDVSPDMIARAEALHDLTSRARYEAGQFEAIDFPDGKFDRVFSMEALYYAVDLDAAIGEIFRVLKPGGVAHIVLDCFREAAHTEHWAEAVGLHMHFLGEADWKSRFEAAGFEPVETSRVIDSRGPGDEGAFTPTEHCPDWASRVAQHEAASLWIQATRPA